VCGWIRNTIGSGSLRATVRLARYGHGHAAELQQALGAEPIVLPAWDPMGALAR